MHECGIFRKLDFMEEQTEKTSSIQIMEWDTDCKIARH